MQGTKLVERHLAPRRGNRRIYPHEIRRGERGMQSKSPDYTSPLLCRVASRAKMKVGELNRGRIIASAVRLDKLRVELRAFSIDFRQVHRTCLLYTSDAAD